MADAGDNDDGRISIINTGYSLKLRRKVAELPPTRKALKANILKATIHRLLQRISVLAYTNSVTIQYMQDKKLLVAYIRATEVQGILAKENGRWNVQQLFMVFSNFSDLF